MKKKAIIAFCFCLFSSCSSMSAIKQTATPDGQDYRIGQGDVLFISVWKDDALTKNCLVLPDGKIHFPLIGELVAADKTIDQLNQEIKDKISKFVPNPDLCIEVKQVNNLAVYVIGRVNRPGIYEWRCNTNVLQTLAMAGGLTPFAEDDEIKIFRQISQKTDVYNFNYEEVEAGKNLEQNILLQRGDVIIVP